jgi:hypothetical protein
MSAPPQARAPNPHTNLLNVYIQIGNKMEVQQKKKPQLSTVLSQYVGSGNGDKLMNMKSLAYKYMLFKEHVSLCKLT